MRWQKRKTSLKNWPKTKQKHQVIVVVFFFLKEKKKKQKQKKQTNVFALNYLHMNIMETDYAHKKTK